MATIIENMYGRRTIRVSTDDVISIIREYQNLTVGSESYGKIREKLDGAELYLPEDL